LVARDGVRLVSLFEGGYLFGGEGHGGRLDGVNDLRGLRCADDGSGDTRFVE